MKIYETPLLFTQNMSDEQQEKFKEFYKEVFKGYNIKSIHDCTIGAGGTTLPLAKLGYSVSGSDLSKNLLDKAKENFNNAGFDIELFEWDCRNIDKDLDGTHDCIISTGNSLAHINNEDVEKFIKAASKKLNSNGLIYIDIRNWDKILREKPIFIANNPTIMTAEEHTSLYFIHNWHDDNSVDFLFINSTDRNGKHVGEVTVQAPPYYPLEYKIYEKILNENGFKVVKCFDEDDLWKCTDEKAIKTGNFEEDFKYINWYGILAQKID